MKKNYYIFSSGKLARKQNTVFFIPGQNDDPMEIEEIEVEAQSEEEKKEDEPKHLPARAIPVESIESIYCFSEMKFNTRFLNFLSQNQIILHFFNYYGYYTGSFYPREVNISGQLLLAQVEHLQDKNKRLILARKFVSAAAENILKNLRYYNTRNKDTSYFIENIELLLKKVHLTENVSELMGIEGNIRNLYYESWNLLIDQDINFNKRERRPPTNLINALISFGNSLVYTVVLSEIYKTQLNPLISYLHEVGTRRFSLALDISEIFKPLLTDRLIFSLLNRNQIQNKHFNEELNGCYLSEEGRKIYLKEFEEKLETTIKHRKLKRSVSYRTLIRLECYKLVKHILGEKMYEPFIIWW